MEDTGTINQREGGKRTRSIYHVFCCRIFYKFDAMAIIFSDERNSIIGYLLTAGIVAGGSKGSIKLFRDFLGWKSNAQKDIEALKQAETKS